MIWHQKVLIILNFVKWLQGVVLIIAYLIGLILNDEIKYVVFHGEFDFGYLLHLFHHSGIPET